MAAIYTAVIRDFAIAECDQCYQLDLYCYSSEEGSRHEFTVDYYGNKDEAVALAQAWTHGLHSVVRAAAGLRAPDQPEVKSYRTGAGCEQVLTSRNACAVCAQNSIEVRNG